MFYINDKHNIRTIALLEAVHLFGSEKNLGLAVKVKQPAVSKWISDPSITIPYDSALMIEMHKGISIERLMPDKKEINAYLRERALGILILREIFKSTIIPTDSVSLPFLQPNRFIIIGTDGVLISGLAILNAYSENKIKALVLDLTSLITEVGSITDLLNKLLISERIAIGLRLEQLIGNRQGQKTTKNQFNQALNSTCYQIIGRTDTHAAKIVGFSKDTYIRGKQVYLSGDQKLINAVDSKTIAIAKAAKLIKLVKQQRSKI